MLYIYIIIYLSVCAANLDDVIELFPLLLQRTVQHVQPRQQPLVDLHGNGHMHGGGECVVGALAAVDVVVGVHGCLGA